MRIGKAEQIPLPNASADAVFVADAFHWFDGSKAVTEFDRVLRRGGGVALLWNLWWNDGDDGTSDSLEPPLPPLARALFDDVYVRSGRAAARAEKADPAACLVTKGSPSAARLAQRRSGITPAARWNASSRSMGGMLSAIGR